MAGRILFGTKFTLSNTDVGLLAIGSGDPTRAICSTLIAEAFESIRYPILPESVSRDGKTYGIAPFVQSEIEHIRQHGLFTPRDSMQPVLRWISDALPLSYAVDAMTRLTNQSSVSGYVVRDLIVIGGAMLLALTLGAVTLRRRTA